jgi:hypothetical protein
MDYVLVFLAGFVCGVAIWLLWLSVRLAADVKEAQKAVGAFVFPGGDTSDDKAREAVEQCKNRLRWQKNMNPEWLPPLIEEVPVLVREIAEAYHPTHENPLLAPGLSQFSRAIHLTAMDVADFLQTKSIGRLVDVSANTAIKTWEVGHRVASNEAMKKAGKWYKRLLPVWQAVRFKSPLMWASLAVSNVAARTLQPALVDIVAHRAMQLYSGRLTPVTPLENGGGEDSSESVSE